MTNQVYIHAGVARASAGDALTLDGPEGKHAAVVKRAGVGEMIDLVDGEGHRTTCEVVTVAGSHLTARVLEVGPEPEPAHPITVVQALTKGGRDEDAIEAGTEVGVHAFVPWQADRSIAKWPAAKARKQWEKWNSAAVTASKQSRRSRFPVIADVVTSAQLAARVREWVDAGFDVFALHETATGSLASRVRESAAGSVLIVGPEGGISPSEIDALTEAGAVPVLLGPTILRAGTAGTVGAAVIQGIVGDWR